MCERGGTGSGPGLEAGSGLDQLTCSACQSLNEAAVNQSIMSALLLLLLLYFFIQIWIWRTLFMPVGQLLVLFKDSRSFNVIPMHIT